MLLSPVEALKSYLNLGCGSRFHPEWTNLDVVSTERNVIAYNLRKNIPFPDNSFQVVYHSHLLEHFPKSEAENFLTECYRVLKPRGIIRIAIPDLEQIAKTYLLALEKACSGSQEWADNYEWIVLEMYDQVVRNSNGGEIFTYLNKEFIPNEGFILQRWGIEAKKLIETLRLDRRAKPSEAPVKHQFTKPLNRFRDLLLHPKHLRELFVKLLLGKEFEMLHIGRFRQSGIIHQWMYDRYSLSVLLKKCGFTKIIQCSAMKSYLSDWASFHLDTEADGTVYKSDSLYMEAIKPEGFRKILEGVRDESRQNEHIELA